MEAAGIRHIYHPSRSDRLTIFCLADWHLLNKACARKRLTQDIEKIRVDPYAFWVGGGDYAEYISPTDPRFDATCFSDDLSPSDLGSLGMKSGEIVRDMMKPIKHKCLGLALGNHEKKFQTKNQHEWLHGYVCDQLGVTNLEYSALFDVCFVRNPRCKKPRLLPPDTLPRTSLSRWTRRIYIHHGAGGAQTPGGKLNKLAQFMQRFDADVYFVAHMHDQKGQRLVTIGANPKCTKLVEHERLGIITGSYLRTYAQGVTTYGEVKGYAPVCLGAAWVSFCPDKQTMHGEV